MSNTTPPSGYLVPPPPGAAPARPGTVTAATGLLYLLALLQLASGALAAYSASFYDRAKVVEIYRDAGATAEVAESAAAGAPMGALFGAVFAVIFGVVYLILAFFVGKGKQWARITTWVFAGLGICCGISSLALLGATDALMGMAGSAGGVDQAQVTRELAELQPGWFEGTTIALGVLALLAAIAVVVLLLLPPSHPYFRKPEPQWTPPTYPAG